MTLREDLEEEEEENVMMLGWGREEDGARMLGGGWFEDGRKARRQGCSEGLGAWSNWLKKLLSSLALSTVPSAVLFLVLWP